MPGAVKYVPATDKERDSFSHDVATERDGRRLKYREALKYYSGDHEDMLDTDPDEPDDNTRINLVKMTAERTSSFLFPDVPKFKIDESAVQATPSEKWLRGFFDASGGLEMLIKLSLRGFLSGHGFLRVVPVPEDQQSYIKYPKIVNLDPTSVSVYWKADDISDVLWYEMRYYSGSTPYVRDFVRDGDRWVIYTYKGVATSPQEKIINIPTPHGEPKYWLNNLVFTGTNFELVGKAVHTSAVPPIVDFPHLPHPDDYYGLGEFTEKDLQDMVNRINSLRNRIVREHSEPVDLITGADADEIEDGGSILSVSEVQARVWRMEMKGDLSGITVVLDKLIETYLAIARVVLLKGEAKDLQRVTNAAVRTLFLDSISKNSILQSSYGRALARVAKLGLLMAYKAGAIEENPVGAEVNVKFGSALPSDLFEIANINTLGLSGGYMSRRTAATNLNMDWTEQQQAIEAEYEWNKKFEETDGVDTEETV